MHFAPQYVDGGSLRKDILKGSSRTTVWRLTQREIDPFPAGFLIGGKRFWKTSKVLEWLARQESATSDPEAEATTAPVEIEPAAPEVADARLRTSPADPGPAGRRRTGKSLTCERRPRHSA